jgi:N-acetylglucosamine-6-phosphate deacetylase
MTKLDGHILTPQGFLQGRIEFSDGRISSVSGKGVTEARVRGSARSIIIPGFVDLHVHGGGGFDVMDGGAAALHVARTHAQCGTTSLLATTMTAPHGDLLLAFAGVAATQRGALAGGARILGVHLEGPYISAKRLGAQPDFARGLQMSELASLNAVTPIRLITLAPEIDGHIEAIAALNAAGYKVNLGHSEASYEQTCAALDAGAHGFTHLYNAMSGFHHRAPGMVGAALAHARHAELIVDLLHVHPGAIRAALRSIAGLYCVTDSTAAAGMPDGEYRLGRQTVTRCMGGVRLADGTLAGSVVTMDQAFRNLVDVMSMSLIEASARTATLAADFIGATDRGRLVAGAFADVVVLNDALNVTDVFVEGRAVDLAR